MATHTRFEGGNRSDWHDVDFVAVVRVAGDEVVILNSDGSETRFFSADGDFVEASGSISGNVTSMARTNEGGAVVYETVSWVGLAISDLLAGSGQLFNLVLGLAVTLSASGGQGSALEIAWWEDRAFYAMATGLADEAALQASVVDHLDAQPAGQFTAVDAAIAFEHLLGSLVIGDDDGSLGVSSSSGSSHAVLDTETSLKSGSAWADYANATGGVIVDLAAGHATLGAEGEVLAASVVNVAGSAFDDWLVGDASNNLIIGGKGNDIITLGAGDDILLVAVGDGLDTITDFGASGHDTINLAGYSGIASFAQLIDEQRLVTINGQAMILLNGGDGLVLQNVQSHTLLTASQFQF